MASNTYWRCLARPRTSNGMLLSTSQHSTRHAAPAMTFSTSTPTSLPAPTKKKAGGAVPTKKGQKVAFSAKKVNARKRKGGDVVKQKPPAVGERKALRKRIVLSNGNALEVEGLAELSEGTSINQDLHGQVLALPGPLIDQLRAAEAFEARQSWGMFRRPAMLIRENTLEIAKMFEKVESSKDSKSATRQIVVGPKGSGKSVYLLQAMSLAYLNKWTVISIPDARDLTVGHTDYTPISGTKPTVYHQKAYTAALLQRIARTNPHLSELQLTSKPNLSVPFRDNISLEAFLMLGANPELSLPVFQHALTELTAPGRPPLLFTMDNFARANEQSEYMSAAFKPVHAHDFLLINTFLEFLNGKKTLPNGGAVLAAMSGNNSANVPALDVRLKQIEAHQQQAAGTFKPSKELALPFLEATGQKPNPIPLADPYVKYDERVLDVLGGKRAALKGTPVKNSVEVKRVSGLNRDEARALMEYWARSGMLNAEVNETLVGQRWTLSGGGVVGELERGCFRMKL